MEKEICLEIKNKLFGHLENKVFVKIHLICISKEKYRFTKEYFTIKDNKILKFGNNHHVGPVIVGDSIEEFALIEQTCREVGSYSGHSREWKKFVSITVEYTCDKLNKFLFKV
jgi:hypothetical protein